VRADPKPAARRIDREAGVEKVRSEGRCRICPATYGLTRHHLVPRSLGGDDSDDNLIPLCFVCHDLYETQPKDQGPGKLIRRSLTKREVGYVLRRKGRVFLDRYYPPG
jgi:5-methylcytosine-specific restriction endonuclease McrA